MNLIWSGKDDSDKGDEPLQDREIYRNCGQILGRLDELMPFIYVTQHGASTWELRQQRTKSAVGLFAVGERQDNGGRSGVVPHVGLVLPVRLCRDETTRTALLEIPALLTRELPMAGRRRPVEEPAQWFVIRPGMPDATIGVRLEMHRYGWARLHLSLDDRNTAIELSEVFDPFCELVAWGREIAEGDLPIQMEIDEEGREAVLTVLRTDDPARVLLRVTRKYEDGILLEGIVARTTLARALKTELRCFFTVEFDPKHWDERDDDRDDLGMSLRDQVLQNPWLGDPE